MYERILSDMRTAMAGIEQGYNPIFGYLGMPGIGKTQMVIQAAKELGLEFFGDMVLSSCSPMDIMGKVPNMEDEVLASLPNDDIPLAYRVGERKGVWFIDEVTNATSDTLKALQQGLLSRRFGKHELGKNVIIVLAGNRQTDKAGSGVLSTAVYNRVTWRNLSWTSDNSDNAVNYIVDKLHDENDPRSIELLAMVTGYFKHMPIIEGDFTDALKQIGKVDFVQWCSPRSLEALLRRAAVSGWNLPNIVDMSGDIGMGRATALASFSSLLGKLPTFAEVKKDPAKAKLPQEVDAKYAMVSMLSVRVREEDFGDVWTYVRRFDESTLRVVFLRMAMKSCPDVRNSADYKKLYKEDVELVKAISEV